MKIREVVAYGNYFHLKSISGSRGLFEVRIQLGSDIWRVFCFFENERLVILLNGFVKKTQKTPKEEIKLAMDLMKRYYDDKSRR